MFRLRLPNSGPFLLPHRFLILFQILLDASDGASDYGNTSGEPLIQSYSRMFRMRLLTSGPFYDHICFLFSLSDSPRRQRLFRMRLENSGPFS
jgi:hypothetical protein